MNIKALEENYAEVVFCGVAFNVEHYAKDQIFISTNDESFDSFCFDKQNDFLWEVEQEVISYFYV